MNGVAHIIYDIIYSFTLHNYVMLLDIHFLFSDNFVHFATGWKTIFYTGI